MATNKDGLEPGQTVDFQTLMRIKRQPREAEEKPAKRTRKQKDQSYEAQETPDLERQKEVRTSGLLAKAD